MSNSKHGNVAAGRSAGGLAMTFERWTRRCAMALGVAGVIGAAAGQCFNIRGLTSVVNNSSIYDSDCVQCFPISVQFTFVPGNSCRAAVTLGPGFVEVDCYYGQQDEYGVCIPIQPLLTIPVQYRPVICRTPCVESPFLPPYEN